MGLDNGIIIKKYNQEVKELFPERWYNFNKEVEPIYMRKWWGVRNDIVSYLCSTYNTNISTTAQWTLTTKDIFAIREILVNWCDEDKWKNDGCSVWDWDLDNIPYQIGYKISVCNKILVLMREYPDMDIEFYDSF